MALPGRSHLHCACVTAQPLGCASDVLCISSLRAFVLRFPIFMFMPRASTNHTPQTVHCVAPDHEHQVFRLLRHAAAIKSTPTTNATAPNDQDQEFATRSYVTCSSVQSRMESGAAKAAASARPPTRHKMPPMKNANALTMVLKLAIAMDRLRLT